MSHLRKRIILWALDFLDFMYNLKKRALIINLFAGNVLLLPNCGKSNLSCHWPSDFISRLNYQHSKIPSPL